MKGLQARRRAPTHRAARSVRTGLAFSVLVDRDCIDHALKQTQWIGHDVIGAMGGAADIHLFGRTLLRPEAHVPKTA